LNSSAHKKSSRASSKLTQTPAFQGRELTFSSFCRTISDKLPSLSSLRDGLGFLCCGRKKQLAERNFCLIRVWKFG